MSTCFASSLFLVSLYISSDPSKLALASKRLSYTRLREIIKEAISIVMILIPNSIVRIVYDLV